MRLLIYLGGIRIGLAGQVDLALFHMQESIGVIFRQHARFIRAHDVIRESGHLGGQLGRGAQGFKRSHCCHTESLLFSSNKIRETASAAPP
ncbi:hypothetical protein SDC9_172311 [bioreactor metagenome]|uniref:Uncharacterized protein n=1 Tax=bioreactor metagenome TaxID=1076179 RepID=A0A645GFG9_9ZZZZ